MFKRIVVLHYVQIKSYRALKSPQTLRKLRDKPKCMFCHCFFALPFDVRYAC